MSKSVATRSAASQAMLTAAQKHRALMGGTNAMRKAGEAYLPKFGAEEPEDYKARLNSSWLFNGYKKTVKDMTGRVFDKPIEVSDAPEVLIDWTENVNMQGQDLSVFARDVFKDGFSAGLSFIMVDAPRRDGETTKAEAKSRNLRPYLTHLKVEDVLGWQTATFDNVLALSQIRIAESVEVQDPDDEFSTITQEFVRVLDRLPGAVRVRLLQKVKEDWSVVDDYTTGAKEITVVPFYAERVGFFAGEPVLEDLADVNLAHWVSQSDQRNILHFARVPILHITGRNDDEPLKVSAGSAVQSKMPDASMTWVEHNGKAIEAGRQDLKDLEFQMETLGLQLLVARTQTATGATLDAAKETSQLAMMADSLKDALEQAMRWMADYGGLGEADVTLKVNTEFGVSMLTPQEFMAMLTAVNTGNMSRVTFIEEMKRRGFLRDDLDTEEEIGRIQDEEPEGLIDGGE